MLGPLGVVEDGDDPDACAPTSSAPCWRSRSSAPTRLSAPTSQAGRAGARVPPDTAPTALHGHVCCCCAELLGSGLQSRPGHRATCCTPSAERIDLRRFGAPAQAGKHRRLRTDRQGRAASRGARAVPRRTARLTCGTESFARDEAARIEGARLAALEERVDVDLALGRDADLVPELERLVAPRTTLCASVPSGSAHGRPLPGPAGRPRSAAGLSGCSGVTLVEELSRIDLGPELQELERGTLTQDPAPWPLPDLGPTSSGGDGAPTDKHSSSPSPLDAVRRHRRLAAFLVVVVVALVVGPAWMVLRGSGHAPRSRATPSASSTSSHSAVLASVRARVTGRGQWRSARAACG